MSYKKIEDITKKLKSNRFTKKLYEKSLTQSERMFLESSYLSDNAKGYIENTIYGTNNIKKIKNVMNIPKIFKESNEGKKLKSVWQSQIGGRKTRKNRKYKRTYKKN